MCITSEPSTQHYTQYARRLAFRLRNLRIQSGLTQTQVAQRAHISAYTYRKFERGESRPGTPMNPKLSTLISLAAVFGVRLGDLLVLEVDSADAQQPASAPPRPASTTQPTEPDSQGPSTDSGPCLKWVP